MVGLASPMIDHFPNTTSNTKTGRYSPCLTPNKPELDMTSLPLLQHCTGICNPSPTDPCRLREPADEFHRDSLTDTEKMPTKPHVGFLSL